VIGLLLIILGGVLLIAAAAAQGVDDVEAALTLVDALIDSGVSPVILLGGVVWWVRSSAREMIEDVRARHSAEVIAAIESAAEDLHRRLEKSEEKREAAAEKAAESASRRHRERLEALRAIKEELIKCGPAAARRE